MDTTVMPDTPTEAVPSPVAPTGLVLTLEETVMLQALWLRAERVDWAVYEKLRMRVLAWPSSGSPAVTIGRIDPRASC